MSHYAKINHDNIVEEVIVAEEDFIKSLDGTWLQTSYNTIGGVYYTPNTQSPDPDQTKAFRKNYATIGYFYDENLNAFIPPKPFDSWTLNINSCLWESPVPQPLERGYYWDEDSLSWKKYDIKE